MTQTGGLNELRHVVGRVLHNLLRLLRWVGVDVYALRRDYHYVPKIYGNRADKLFDIRDIQQFRRLAEGAMQNKRTYLYYDRLYTLFQAIRNVRALARDTSKVNLAEVGVYRGGGTYFLAQTAQEFGLDNAHVYGFDTFEGHPEQDVRPVLEPAQKPGVANYEASFEDTRGYLDRFKNVELIKGRFQDVCSRIRDMRFHLVHLDVDIYEPTRFALDFFSKRLVVGGIVVVDDYGFVTCPGIQKATQEFVASHHDFVSVDLLTGQCVLVKTGS